MVPSRPISREQQAVLNASIAKWVAAIEAKPPRERHSHWSRLWSNARQDVAGSGDHPGGERGDVEVRA